MLGELTKGSEKTLTSRIPLIPATAQFCFKYYNAKTKKVTWRSIGGSSFKANGRSCKANEWVGNC